MRKFLLAASTIAIACAGPSQAALWSGKYVNQILVDNSRQCAFFTLTGVSQSDPIASGSWFAISKTSPNYQEQISILISAKLSNRPLEILTDGSISCGWGNVSTITLD